MVFEGLDPGFLKDLDVIGFFRFWIFGSFDTGFWIGFFGYGSFSFADTKMLKLAGVSKLFRLRSDFARRR